MIHQVGLIGVHGKASGDPVLLILSAYDPVIWDFAEFPLNRLRGVLIYGYHDQAVANLPEGMETRFIPRRGEGECGQHAYAYKGGNELDGLNAQVRYATGREIDSFFGGYDPAALHADGGGIRPGQARMPKPEAVRGSAALDWNPSPGAPTL